MKRECTLLYGSNEDLELIGEKDYYKEISDTVLLQNKHVKCLNLQRINLDLMDTGYSQKQNMGKVLSSANLTCSLFSKRQLYKVTSDESMGGYT